MIELIKESHLHPKTRTAFHGYILRICKVGVFLGFEDEIFWKQRFWIAPVRFT
jgi:hypothetical protein